MTKSRHRLQKKQNTESPALCRRIIGNQSRIIRSKPLRSGHLISYEHLGGKKKRMKAFRFFLLPRYLVISDEESACSLNLH